MVESAIHISKKSDDAYKVISVRIKEGTLHKIDDLSGKSNRSRNEVINILLESTIDNVQLIV